MGFTGYALKKLTQKPEGKVVLQAVEEKLLDIKATTEEFTAPVSMPTREMMRVDLAPIHLLDRLEEYRSDQSIWSAYLGLLVGTLFSVPANLATGGEMTIFAWLLVGTLLVGIIFIAWGYYQQGKRIEKVRGQIFDKKEE